MRKEKRSITKPLLIAMAAIFLLICILSGIIGSFITTRGISFRGWLSAYKSFFTWMIIIVGNGLMLIFVLMNFSLNLKRDVMRENADLEDSHFLTKKELKKNPDFVCTTFDNLSNTEDGVVVGAKLEKSGKMKILLTSPSHTLTIGTTGSGKTYCFINQNIEILARTKTKPSIIISDVKGELYLAHSNMLKKQGYKVQLLDLIEPYSSTHWNPCEVILLRIREILEIDEIESVSGKYRTRSRVYNTLHEATVRKKTLQDEIYELCKDLVWAICPIENKTQPNWEKGARSLILALVLAFTEDVLDGSMRQEQFCLYNIYFNLQNYCTAEPSELIDYLITSRNSYSPVIGHAKTVLLTTENTLASYLSDVSEYISWLADRGICALTSTNEIDIREFDETPTAVFIRVPDYRETRHNLVTLFTMQTYKELVEKATQNERDDATESATLKRRIYMILDEFGNLPKISNLRNIVTVARSRGIFMTLVLQSYRQLTDKYGEADSDTIKGQCNNKVYIGTDEEKTVAEFSALCGKRTVQRVSMSSGGSSDAAGANTSASEIPLINTGELRRLNKKGSYGNLILARFGQYPLRSYITPYFASREFYGYEKAKFSRSPKVFEEQSLAYDIGALSCVSEPDEREQRGEAPKVNVEQLTYRQTLDRLSSKLSEMTLKVKDCISEADYSLIEHYAKEMNVSMLGKLLNQIKESQRSVSVRARITEFENYVNNVFAPEFDGLIAGIEKEYSEAMAK